MGSIHSIYSLVHVPLPAQHNKCVCVGGGSSKGGASDGRRHGRGRPAVPDSLASSLCKLGGESFSNHKIGLEKAGGETRG